MEKIVLKTLDTKSFRSQPAILVFDDSEPDRFDSKFIGSDLTAPSCLIYFTKHGKVGP